MGGIFSCLSLLLPRRRSGSLPEGLGGWGQRGTGDGGVIGGLSGDAAGSSR